MINRTLLHTPIFHIICTLCLLLVFVTPLTGQAKLLQVTPGDEYWSKQFGINGIVGGKSMVMDASGNLYVGSVTAAGSTLIKGVARWDGTQWSQFGSDFNPNLYIQHLAFDTSGYLYGSGSNFLSGNFNIYRSNGSTWTALSEGFDGPIDSIAFDPIHHYLYVGGQFSKIGAVNVPGIAKWNGSSWSSVGSTISWHFDMVVDSNGILYSSDSDNVSKWNGQEWQRIGSFNAPVNAIKFDDLGNLYAGGQFDAVGNLSANHIAKWDGVKWSALGAGVNDIVYALTIDNHHNLYAAGLFSSAGSLQTNHVAIWNGQSWLALQNGINGEVYYLLNDRDGNLYAVGYFTIAGNIAASNIAKWDGSKWSAIQGYGVSGDILALSKGKNGKLFAGGRFVTAGNTLANYIASWNGHTWETTGTGMNGPVWALASGSNGSIYAGGEFTSSGSSNTNHIAKWDGQRWSPLGKGMNGTVKTLLMDENDMLYAGGEFTTAGDVTVNGIAKWDGNQWSSLGSGVHSNSFLHDGSVLSMAFDLNGFLYAGGDFTSAGEISADHIARWDGGNWSALGSGIDASVYSLIVDKKNQLYASGSFSKAGGISANKIAQWDGQNWSPVGDGMGTDNIGAYSMVIDYQNQLIVSGNFLKAGGIPVNFVARWDGIKWSGFGSGLDSGINNPGFQPVSFGYALAIDEKYDLIIGGTFTKAGEHVSKNIANYNLPNPLPRIDLLAPSCVLTASPAFELQVIGDYFIPESVVRWNGTEIPTTYIDNHRLTILVTADQIAKAGIASVTVLSPEPAGGISNTKTFVTGRPAYLPIINK